MRKTLVRVCSVVAPALALATLAACGVLASQAVHREQSTVQPAVTRPAACTHGQSCWNDCTMGGPCDALSRLPRGEAFTISWKPLADVHGWDCGPGWQPTHVDVQVFGPPDWSRVISTASDDACLPADVHLVAGEVQQLLPNLFRQAGARA